MLNFSNLKFQPFSSERLKMPRQNWDFVILQPFPCCGSGKSAIYLLVTHKLFKVEKRQICSWSIDQKCKWSGCSCGRIYVPGNSKCPRSYIPYFPIFSNLQYAIDCQPSNLIPKYIIFYQQPSWIPYKTFDILLFSWHMKKIIQPTNLLIP